MSRTFWNFIMHGGSVGCEITGRRTRSDARYEKEDARKRGGGADKRGGAHSRYLDVENRGGGGGADKRWGALWRYSTVQLLRYYHDLCLTTHSHHRNSLWPFHTHCSRPLSWRWESLRLIPSSSAPLQSSSIPSQPTCCGSYSSSSCPSFCRTCWSVGVLSLPLSLPPSLIPSLPPSLHSLPPSLPLSIPPSLPRPFPPSLSLCLSLSAFRWVHWLSNFVIVHTVFLLCRLVWQLMTLKVYKRKLHSRKSPYRCIELNTAVTVIHCTSIIRMIESTVWKCSSAHCISTVHKQKHNYAYRN